MRGLILNLFFVGLVPTTLYAPYVGIYAFYWYSFAAPHRQAFGVPLDYGKVLAISTLLTWLFSRASKKLPNNAVTILIIAFYLWTCLSTLLAQFPKPATSEFVEWSKVILMVVVAQAVINTRFRLHCLIWILAISLSYYGVKGGLWTLFTGGAAVVYGPKGTSIYNSNEIARAIMMGIPLTFFLTFHSKQPLIRIGAFFATGLNVLGMMGTNSRTALLAFGTMCVLLWIYSRHKLRYLIVGFVLGAAVLAALPQSRIDSMFGRYSSIGEYETDDSFNSRITIWSHIVDHVSGSPIWGHGFDVTENTYGRAPHSNYFEVLAEHGYFGLMIYLMLCLSAVAMSIKLTRLGKRAPKYYWARDFGIMMQCILCGYLVGGITKNHAHFELFYIELAMMVAAFTVVKRQIDDEIAVERAEQLEARRATYQAAMASHAYQND